MLTKIPSTLITLTISAAMFGCSGGSSIDVEKTKHDLAHPTGSISDQSGITAALEAGKTGRDAARVPGKITDAIMGDRGDCGAEINRDAMEVLNAQKAGEPYSKSFSGSFDIAKCGRGLSGKVDLHAQFDVTAKPKQTLSETVTVTFSKACDDGGACVDGEEYVEGKGGEGRLELLAIFDASISAGGQATRVKVAVDERQEGDSPMWTEATLVYVRNSAAKEVSYVLRSTDGPGGVVLKIAGADGEASCAVDESGSMHCGGSAH